MLSKRSSKILILTLSIVFVLSLWVGAEDLTILHTNDIHGNYLPKEEGIGGFKALSHYLSEARSESEGPNFLFDAGDVMTGTPLTQIEFHGAKGGAMFELMNFLGYDAWTYGNHAFDLGQENARAITEVARFPTVNTNIVEIESGDLFAGQPYAIVEKDGMKVGVLGSMESIFKQEILKEATEGLDVLPVVSALEPYADFLEKRVDLVVVLSQMGWEESKEILDEVNSVDVVVAATHPEETYMTDDGRVMHSTNEGDTSLGYLHLNIDNGEITQADTGIYELNTENISPDPVVGAMVDKFREMVSAQLDMVVGSTACELVPNNTEESNLGDWETDVMRWKTGTDIAFENSGGIRRNIPKGEITKRIINEVAPFGNTLVTFELKGSKLKKIFETGVERGGDRLEVSGVTYKVDPDKPEGERVMDIMVHGEPYDPDATYSITTNNYVVGQAEDKYFGFPVEDFRNTYIKRSSTLIEWIQEHGTIGEGYCEPQGRIQEVD
ncbi:bifunctional metallophosphatase/5'-nucleotidase [Candidatus Bipolaricaulota bacterium]|nr:bifunctional metallophosphatase/5'-nucleotidase [Candidatus Bipolaricaulota bacterium]